MTKHARSRAPAPSTTLDVVVTWAGTTLAVERLAPGAIFSVGPHGTFPCNDPVIPDTCFALVTHVDGVARVAAAPGMRLIVDGRDAGASAVELAPGQGRVRVVVGPLCFDVRFDRAAATACGERRRDDRFLAASGTALALQAGLVAALLLAPASDPELLPMPTTSTARALFTVPKTPARTVAAATAAAAASTAPQARVTARALPKRATAAPSARELVNGALAALGLAGGGGPAALPGLVGGLGQLRGAASAAVGDGGLATRALGPGGGGDGTVGIGGLRLGGDRDGRDPGGARLIARERRPVVVLDRDFSPSDGLTRDEIQRVLARALPRIKHCYERELGGAPDLEGKVTSTFTVAGSGAVAAVTSAHSMAEPAVARCVDGVLRTLTFPHPRGGGQVVVTYPFVFTLAGG